MNLERRVADNVPAQAAELPDVDGSQTQAVEIDERGQALLDAADAAITRALSRDSRQFLTQGRQSSGQ